MDGRTQHGRPMKDWLIRLDRAFAEFLFHRFLEKNIRIEFKRSPGGQEIICQIRLFGWLVGSQTVFQKPRPDGAHLKKVD